MKQERRSARYAVAATAAGPLIVAAREGHPLAVRFGFDAARLPEELGRMHDELGGRFALVEDEDALAPLVRQLTDLVEGRRERIEAEPDLSWLTPFQRNVLGEVARVPRGQVITYAEVARRIGRPTAYRAVGNALHINPLPVIIPCHRVVGSNGIGGFGGSVEMKRRLLALEGVVFA
jgi:methylated-DNA-[protein]-cysteine S-methyltransferase